MIPQQPLLKLLHAVPNGAKLPYRKKIIGDRVVRACRQAIRLKREGLTAGIPDLSWPVPRGRFHGLYIETKSPDGKVSKDQAAIHALLLQQGYQVLVLRDPEVIIREILAYWMAGPFSG